MDLKQTFAQQGVTPPPDDYFEQIRKRMEQQPSTARQLTVEEERKMQDGFAVEEMAKGAGWAIVAEILAMMPLSNIDPRGMKEEDWKFAQLNAFWQGEVAKELQESIRLLIQEAHELHRIKMGETPSAQKMRF